MEIADRGLQNLIYNVQPTLYGRNILSILSLLRWCFLYKPFNRTFEFDFFATEYLHICVFLIGVCITVECFLSTLNYIFCLKLPALLRQYRISYRLSSCLFLFGIASSVAHAVWLFIQVRKMWSQHFSLLIQFLHGVPSCLLVLQSITQGLYILIMRVGGDMPPEEARGVINHLKSQNGLNVMLLIYSVTTAIAIAYHSQSLFAFASIFYLLGEMAYRVYSYYAIKSLSIGAESIEERNYDSVKEWFYLQMKKYIQTISFVLGFTLLRRFKISYRLLFIYSIAAGIALVLNSLPIIICASVIYVLVEIGHQVFTYANKLEEEVDPFPYSVEEKKYCSLKERFCSGMKKKIPLLDTFCRWVW